MWKPDYMWTEYFQKPLLESGTLGTKCNTQVVIPHATENYGASTDPPEKQAPMCTLHSFPHNIDHCLTWARSEFEGLMEKTPLEANAYLADPEGYLRSLKSVGEMQAKERLQSVVESLIEERCASFEDCLVWARHRFEDCFVSRVKQLISTFPEDATSSSGTPFWSAPKRFPKPLEFNLSDHTCLSFITAASMLRAEIYRLSVPEWASVPSKLAEFVDEIEVPEYKPKPAGAVAREENASGSQPLTKTDNTGGSVSGQDADSDSPIGQLTSALEAAVHKLPLGFSMNPVIFEKDDDSNHHMDLIAGLANVRARNYNIPEVDKLKAKLIAGQIIPAIATTTAMATGLVCLELYKVFLGHRIDMYRNTFANLALPLFSMAEPVSAKTIKHAELSWSVWDRWTIREDLSVRELLDWFQAKGLTAYSVTCGSTCLYNSYFPKHRERMERKLVELARDVAKFQVSANHRHLDLSVGCEDADGNDVEAPLVSISLFQSVNDLPPSGDRA